MIPPSKAGLALRVLDDLWAEASKTGRAGLVSGRAALLGPYVNRKWQDVFMHGRRYHFVIIAIHELPDLQASVEQGIAFEIAKELTK